MAGKNTKPSFTNLPDLEKSQHSLDQKPTTFRDDDLQFARVHLELATDATEPVTLDAIQVKAYCTAALKQFLGLTGVAIPIDIIKVEGINTLVQLPPADLRSFTAAITSWRGTVEDDSQRFLRVKQNSDWLGSTTVGPNGE